MTKIWALSGLYLLWLCPQYRYNLSMTPFPIFFHRSILHCHFLDAADGRTPHCCPISRNNARNPPHGSSRRTVGCIASSVRRRRRGRGGRGGSGGLISNRGEEIEGGGSKGERYVSKSCSQLWRIDATFTSPNSYMLVIKLIIDWQYPLSWSMGRIHPSGS